MSGLVWDYLQLEFVPETTGKTSWGVSEGSVAKEPFSFACPDRLGLVKTILGFWI